MPLKEVFPKLTRANFRITSPSSSAYNCVAWAAEDDQRWWEPAIGEGYFWPEVADKDYTIEALLQVYSAVGDSICEDASIEPGSQKVAIFGDSQGYTHVARQLQNGKWTSKLGFLEDIEHDSLDALEGQEYGAVVCVMRRQTGKQVAINPL